MEIQRKNNRRKPMFRIKSILIKDLKARTNFT